MPHRFRNIGEGACAIVSAHPSLFLICERKSGPLASRKRSRSTFGRFARVYREAPLAAADRAGPRMGHQRRGAPAPCAHRAVALVSPDRTRIA